MEIYSKSKANKETYMLLHISKLKVYKEPKDIREFRNASKCRDYNEYFSDCYAEEWCGCYGTEECINGHLRLNKVPQSWCYIYEV